MARAEEIHPAGVGQPLADHRECDLVVVVELGQHGFRVFAHDNAEVDRELAGGPSRGECQTRYQ